jgi:hypothetical protein
LPLDEQHHRDQQWNEDDDQVRAIAELLGHHDDEDDRGQHRADGVDDAPPAPAGLAHLPPMLDHPDLAQREAHEHAHRVQRDQRMGVATERPQQPERDRCQEHYPPRIGEPVAAERELTWHVAVLGQDRGEAREGIEARVRGEEQDEGCGRGEGNEQGGPVAERR